MTMCLHYPSMKILSKQLVTPISIVYVAQKCADCITYVDLDDKIMLKVSKLLTQINLVLELQKGNLISERYKPGLQERLQGTLIVK